MNRPIKFRAYDPKTGEMIYFEHGFAEMFGYFSNPEQMDRFPRLIWMQFTGLHNKHGKEIYEGDIVRVVHGNHDWYAKSRKEKEFNCEVVFGESTASFHYKWPRSYGDYRFGSSLGKDVETIGNRYENPELITLPS